MGTSHLGRTVQLV